MRHMTDDEMQAYLDQGESSLDRVFDRHLGECSICQQAVNQYRLLYEHLSEPDKANPPVYFADTVVSQLSAEFISQRWRRFWIGVGVSLAMLMSLVFSLGYFGPAQSIKVALLSVTEPFIRLFSTILSWPGEINSGQTGAQIIVFSVIIVITIAVADAFLKFIRARNICI